MQYFQPCNVPIANQLAPEVGASNVKMGAEQILNFETSYLVLAALTLICIQYHYLGQYSVMNSLIFGGTATDQQHTSYHSGPLQAVPSASRPVSMRLGKLHRELINWIFWRTHLPRQDSTKQEQALILWRFWVSTSEQTLKRSNE